MKKSELVDALIKSRELIKLGWIKGAWARNKEGKQVEPWAEDACKFCVEGAILGATHFQDPNHGLAAAAIQVLQAANKEFSDLTTLNRIAKGHNSSKVTPHSVVPGVNDSSKTTHEQIVHLFDNAIILAKHMRFPK